MEIIEIWKKIKLIRRIITISSIIITVISIYLWCFSFAVNTELIDLKDIGIFDVLKESSSTGGTASQQAIADKAEEIAKFYKQCGDYVYSISTPFDLHYKEAKYHKSCCSIYVIQVLVELGLTDTFGEYDCRILIKFL